jgi:hypothetical protein
MTTLEEQDMALIRGRDFELEEFEDDDEDTTTDEDDEEDEEERGGMTEFSQSYTIEQRGGVVERKPISRFLNPSVIFVAILFASLSAYAAWASVLILGRIRGIDNLLVFNIVLTCLLAGVYIVWMLVDFFWWRHKVSKLYGVFAVRSQWIGRMLAFWIITQWLIQFWIFYGDNGNTNAKNYNFRQRVDWRIIVAVAATPVAHFFATGIKTIGAFSTPVHQVMT